MSFVAGRRVLVTGGAGFLGREVCRQLQALGPAQLIVPRSREHDLRRYELIDRLFDEVRPQTVIHLAAVVGGIGANRVNPGKYFYDNAVMGIELLEAARRYDVEKYVVTGSICAYPKFTPVPFREEEMWNGYPEETNAPYGLAKKMLLVQAQAYRQQYGTNAISLFPVNLYGPHDNFDLETSHVIPALIRKAITARNENRPTLEVWGTGSASREFLYVRDAARGIIAGTEHYNGSEPVNLGSGEEVGIRSLVETICELCDFRGETMWDHTKPDGQPRRCLDTSRALAEFGWQNQTSLRDGLRETIDWFEQSSLNPNALQAA